MTSKLTREENVQAVFDLKAGYTLGIADVEILKRVARMALAAMDSEPVATLDVQSRRPDGNKFALVFSSAAHKLPDDVYFLYRHAQPAQTGVDDDVRNIIGLLETNEWAEHCTETVLGSRLEAEITRLVGSAQTAPVVPDKMTYQDGVLFILNNDMSSIERGTVAMRAWNACRAAMLQAQSDDDGEPTDDERIMAIEGIHNCERCGDEGWVVGEMGITRCACGQAGNSPVIPDSSSIMLTRWLAFGRGMQNAGCQLPHNLIAETESMLAAAPQSPGSEPATVPGKWIPVSERMPETDGNYWGWWSESKRQGPVWFIKSELQAQFQSSEITHWMPLPAAPQEVKGE